MDENENITKRGEEKGGIGGGDENTKREKEKEEM